MKFAAAALLLAGTNALRYAESEGPTKVDFGEADPSVVEREADIGNGVKKSGWTNPLGWTDGGDGDETVLTMLDGSLRPVDDVLIMHPLDEGYTNMPYKPLDIYDEDGDGVEDNIHFTHDELDRFYIPNYFNTADEIYNTHHGNLPGHVQKIMESSPDEEGPKWGADPDYFSLAQAGGMQTETYKI